LKRDPAGGLRVLSVLPGGAAAEAGVRTGDLIELIEGNEARYMDYWPLRHLFSRPAGTRLRLHIRRNGATFDVVVVLGQTV